MITAKLAACPVPWCGGEAKLEYCVCIFKPGVHKDHAVTCQKCGCSTGVKCADVDVVALWNARPTPSNVDSDTAALVEEARALFDKLTRTERKRVRYSGKVTEQDYHSVAVNPDGLTAMIVIDRLINALASRSADGGDEEQVERVAKRLFGVENAYASDDPYVPERYWALARAAIAAMPLRSAVQVEGEDGPR